MEHYDGFTLIEGKVRVVHESRPCPRLSPYHIANSTVDFSGLSLIGGNSQVLERSYHPIRILGRIAASADGHYLAAAGYKVSSGPGAFYGYGAVYLFDRNGQIQWNVSSNREIFSVHINGNGSVIVANG